ncbi:MAG: trypsin-like serine peptidase [Bdellovibrio sp.]
MLNLKIKNLFFGVTILSSLFSINSAAVINASGLKLLAVYGEDDRTEPFNVGAKEYELSKSIAGRISIDHLVSNGGAFKVTRKTLGEEKCSKNRFAEQTLGPTCSGFLVRPNILVTAAHCMTTAESCTQNVWVFDYALKTAGDKSYTNVSSEKVYKCKQIISRRYSDFGNIDYAIVELDRPVKDRNFLEMDFSPNSPSMETPTFAVGHPSGLPLKVTLDGRVLRNNNPYSFDTDLDIFQGNSGSPVFDQNTGKVIGITSHGHEDYTRDKNDPTCKIPKICTPADNCYPSTASRVLNLENDFKKILELEK